MGVTLGLSPVSLWMDFMRLNQCCALRDSHNVGCCVLGKHRHLLVELMFCFPFSFLMEKAQGPSMPHHSVMRELWQEQGIKWLVQGCLYAFAGV